MIKRLLSLILVMGLMILSACEDDDIIDPSIPDKIDVLESELLSSEYIEWYGRTQVVDEKVYFYYTATGFKIEFTGRVVDITFALEDKINDIYFSVGKDGESLLTSDVIVLSDALETFRIEFDSYERHSLEVVKRSEPEDGITSLVSVKTNGNFEAVEVIDKPHFLIIGASGISGHGALGEEGQPRTTENSSSLHAFGYLVADRYGGSVEFVSNSGWGLLYGYNDRTGNINIQVAYEHVGIDPNQDIIDVAYDHEMVPDVVIINIGGNDYTSVISSATGFDKDEKIQAFKQAVATFILKLRSDAPDAHIIWTMTEGSQNGSAALDVINLLDEEDKAFVHMVVIKQVGEDGDPEGANNHASYVTHQKSAIEIINELDLYVDFD